ncbi:MAG: hypothetical protein ACI31X_01520 [Lactobacillus amylovorus]
MKEFFIKGKKVKPGLTITTGRHTYVVTNEYKLHYVESGNHAEVHVSKEEMRSIRNYLMIRPFLKMADAVAKADRVIDRKLNGIE